MKFVAVGPTLLDYSLKAHPYQIDGEVGGWKFIEEKDLLAILTSFKTAQYSFGGSSLNTSRLMAKLSSRLSLKKLHLYFVTIIGNQEKDLFLEAMKELQITFDATYVDEKTSIVICYITEDSQGGKERTMRTSHGTADLLLDLKNHYFSEETLFHLEGYRLYDSSLIEKIRQSPYQISLGLGGEKIIKECKNVLFSLLEEGKIKVLFGNAKEAKTLMQLRGAPPSGQGPKEACYYLKSFVDLAVITNGSEGFYYNEGPLVSYQKAFPITPSEVVDPTGAGDQCSGAFLAFYLEGYSLSFSAEMAAFIASLGLKEFGGDLKSEESWNLIQKKFEEKRE